MKVVMVRSHRTHYKSCNKHNAFASRVLLHALPYYLYKESYENLVLTSDSLAVVPVHDRALEQLAKLVCG